MILLSTKSGLNGISGPSIIIKVIHVTDSPLKTTNS